MGRKDATSVGAANASRKDTKLMPVDSYRKKIGKQDYMKSKKEMKAMKKRKEAKESSMKILDVLWVLLAFLATIAGVYCFLYLYLTPSQGKEIPVHEKT